MSLLVPAQHPHDAEGAPTAGLSLALVHGEVQQARRGSAMASAVLAAALLDQADCLGNPLVRCDAGSAQVLEPLSAS